MAFHRDCQDRTFLEQPCSRRELRRCIDAVCQLGYWVLGTRAPMFGSPSASHREAINNLNRGCVAPSPPRAPGLSLPWLLAWGPLHWEELSVEAPRVRMVGGLLELLRPLLRVRCSLTRLQIRRSVVCSSVTTGCPCRRRVPMSSPICEPSTPPNVCSKTSCMASLMYPLPCAANRTSRPALQPSSRSALASRSVCHARRTRLLVGLGLSLLLRYSARL